MNHVAATGKTDGCTTFQSGKDRRESVIVVLCPLVQWMVVAIGTAKPHTHHGLRDVLGFFASRGEKSVNGCRADLMCIAFR